jgi:UDP-N-acetylmuramoyl-tripeptide--D-alanyl-D-alanine ligase
MEISLKDIKDRISGIEILNYNEERSFSKFSHDTRELEENSLYIPIAGDNSDGHEYIKEAFSKGSVVSLCDKSRQDSIEGVSSPVILTDNVLDTLGKIVNMYTEEIKRNAKIIAITGSTGKTTTREMISSVLHEDGRVLHSDKNFNTLWGNAEILDNYTDEKYVVLEFGMDKKGEIKALCEAINPNAGVFLNVGYVHAEDLGSRENIFNEKRALADFLSDTNGFLALNIDDERLKEIQQTFKGRLMTFGKSDNADVEIKDTGLSLEETDLTISFKGEEYGLHLKVLGRDYAYNACAAFCIGIDMGLDPSQIVDGLEKYEGFGGRFQVMNIDENVSIINDAYNANPTSMKMSVETFSELYKDEDKEEILILGDMRALGQYTEEEHKKIGKLVQDLGFDISNVYYLGEYFDYFNYGNRLNSLDDAVKLINRYIQEKRKAIFLIKGSHSTELYKVAELITPPDISA